MKINHIKTDKCTIKVGNKVLGEGEHGIVYVGQDEQNNKYTVKLYNPKKHLADSPVEFHNEHKLLKKQNLDSRLYQLPNQGLCLVKKYIPGNNLAIRPNKDTLDSKRKKTPGILDKLEDQLIEAVKENSYSKTNSSFKSLLKIYVLAFEEIQKMHQAGVVHTDLHSENILFDIKSNQLKIIDFGGAKEIDNVKNAAELKKEDYKELVCNFLLKVKAQCSTLQTPLANMVKNEIKSLDSYLSGILDGKYKVNTVIQLMKNKENQIAYKESADDFRFSRKRKPTQLKESNFTKKMKIS